MGKMFCYSGGSAEITEKKSRFIADVMPVTSPEEAQDFISSRKKQYWDARHNCYAWVTQNPFAVKCSDDGEPQKTAGRPILDIINGRDITNICIVVSRYFGGTLLGTGGLIRAYSSATVAGLDNSIILEVLDGYTSTWSMDYDIYGRVSYYTDKEKIMIIDTVFEDKVKLKLLVPEKKQEDFLSFLSEETGGELKPECSENVEYAMLDGKPVGCYNKKL